MSLRKGKTKSTLESSVDSALLAVEVYNKPRAAFRTEAYITLMIVAWTRLLHAYFNKNIGDKYFYKIKGSNRYDVVDGERKAWELKKCISKYGKFNDSEIANLELFIKLRNKIEHRHIEKREMDVLLFGECQSLLFNYEKHLIENFGSEYAISESLVYSLQFSALRKDEQIKANRKALSADYAEIKRFIETYRSSLSEEIFNAQEYSIKLIQIPKIANTNRNDLAIEYVRWDSLNADDRENYQKLDAIVKDKVVKQPVINMGGMKPTKVLEFVKKEAGVDITHFDHKCLLEIFKVRPDPTEDLDPFSTIPDYCMFDELHNDYVYFQAWGECIVNILNANKMNRHTWKQAQKHKRRYIIADYI
jgi:hypothetical protein